MPINHTPISSSTNFLLPDGATGTVVHYDDGTHMVRRTSWVYTVQTTSFVAPGAHTSSNAPIPATITRHAMTPVQTTAMSISIPPLLG